eukprot:SAG11_NODE_788_length_7169_cov_1.889109_4_plen_214_part_00
MPPPPPPLAEDSELRLGGEALPAGAYDVNGQQLDLRRVNSWLLKLGEIETVEAAEVFAINALGPFTLNSKLKPLLLAATQLDIGAGGEPEGGGGGRDAFIVNVSAMEGKFYRFKTANHPHTNMAKAALNMLTRTASDDLRTMRIYMNSVDTGWINDENPLDKAARIAVENQFQTPIDEIDAAARILDPVLVGCHRPPTLHYGAFFKDYRLTEW